MTDLNKREGTPAGPELPNAEPTEVPLPTVPGELPNFHAMDPMRFQGLCRDLYQAEPNIATTEVFGSPGQSQRGIDVLAIHRNDDGVSVGQCKRIEPAALTPTLIQAASAEFLKHIDYWRGRQVRRFILFVSPDASRREVSEEYLQQRTTFKNLGIDYELWGQSMLVNKLRPHPGITRTYLRDPWTEAICGGGVFGFPRESTLIDRVLHAQVDILTRQVSTAAENEVEGLRSRWREGKRDDAVEGLVRLREPGRWVAFPDTLRARIVRFEAQLAIESDDVARAQTLADEAERLDPKANVRLRALIARHRVGVDEALRVLGDSTDVDDVDAITLRAGLLLESGRITDALAVLERLTGNAEVHRLRALAYVLDRDLPQARLEIDKAVELAPGWQSVLYGKAIVYYVSGLSPAVLPRALPSWPEPEHWEFVKTDDNSRGCFRTAADALAQINPETQGADERSLCETWRLASMANDPERRDEASGFARELLTREPGHYRALVWTIARRLDVDLARSVQTLKERSNPSIYEVVTLVLLRLHMGESAAATTLLNETRSLFLQANASDLWTLWTAQAAAAAREPWPEALPVGAETPESQLVRLRAGALVTGHWDELISELQVRHASGDGRASFELCQMLAKQDRWHEAAEIARRLMVSVSTAESLRLACGTLYNAKAYGEALTMLDAHRFVFPHAELPGDMRRLRVLAQRHLGMLPTATAEAEDLFRQSPSSAHFSILADLYFQKGDFAALALLARKHEQFDEMSAIDLLRLAMRVGAEDRTLARALWRRASSGGFADSELNWAIELGYKFGLDKELRTLLARIMNLAEKPDAKAHRMSLDEVKALVRARRNDTERIYQMYRAGEIPVHFFAEYLNRPVSVLYHRTLMVNEKSGYSNAGPTFTRHGWRTGQSVRFEVGSRVQLHADTTALLTAQHFGLLDDVEAAFRPISLPHRTLIALAHMRDSTLPHQPSRQGNLQELRDLVSSHAIKAAPMPSSEASSSLDEAVFRWVATEGWLLADFLPLRGVDGHALVLTPEDAARLRDGHCFVDALRSLGELSEEEYAVAREALGHEGEQPSVRDLSRGAPILCSVGILERLAAAGILSAASRVFALRVRSDDFDTAVVKELEAFHDSEADALWLTELLNRVNRGIEQGIYQLLPEVGDPDQMTAEGAGDSPTLSCFQDLFRIVSAEGDAIWVDDRWTTGYVHKDGAPILDTLDLLHILRERGTIAASRFLAIVHRFRDADLRLFSICEQEVIDRTRQTTAVGRVLEETRELRTLRRQHSRTVADGQNLILSTQDGQGSVEWPYLLSSSASVLNAVVEIWGEDQPEEKAVARAEWVLRNLYIPDRGRTLSSVDSSSSVDHQLEALSLTAFVAHAITLTSGDEQSQKTKRRYLEWIYGRLVRRRMDADPKLATTIVDSLKRVMIHAMGGSSTDVDPHVRRMLVRQHIADMPDELSARFADDPAFLDALGVSRSRIFRIGPHEVNAEAFWNVAVEAVRARREQSVNAAGHELTVRVQESPGLTQLVVEDSRARRHYLLLPNEIGILADSLAVREDTAKRIVKSLDLPDNVAEEAIVRIASIKAPSDRILETVTLRRASAQNHYAELERIVTEGESFEPEDILLEDVPALLHHLRLDEGSDGVPVRLEHASRVLLDEAGLEQTIVRLAGIPRPLTDTIVNGFDALEGHQQRALLARLTRLLGRSPIGSMHVARLGARARVGRATYLRYVRYRARRAVVGLFTTRGEAWREVLRVCADELAHVAAFRQLSSGARLCLVWAHGDRIFRILANAGAQEQWIRDKFGTWSSRLPAEVMFVDTAYLTEATHPERLQPMMFGLAAAAHILKVDDIDEPLRDEVARFIESEPSRLLSLLRQPGLRPDSLDSILSPRGALQALELLPVTLRGRVAPTGLMSQVALGLDQILAGQPSPGWRVLAAVVDDQELPPEFNDRLRTAISSIDLRSLLNAEKELAIFAAVFASRQAARFGPEVVTHVRSQLIGLAEEMAAAVPPTQTDDAFTQALLSCPTYLYSHGAIDEGSRFRYIADLLEEIVRRLPDSISGLQSFVDRLVEGLPNHDSRALWPLQVRLRALR